MQTKSKFKIMSMIIFFGFMNIIAQELAPPLIINNFERVTTHEELINYLNKLVIASQSISKEIIGKSVEGRNIPMIIYSGNGKESHVKVLLLCQQHGNEPTGKEAALLLIQKLAKDKNKELFKNLDLYIIPSLNPDGNEVYKRSNSNKADLNRNHLLLSEPEVQALH